MSPTQKALQQLKIRECPAEVVEKWNAFSKTKKDLFNVIDIIAIKYSFIEGIQVTSESNVSARIKKVYENEHIIRKWLVAGGVFSIWGFTSKVQEKFLACEFRLVENALCHTKTQLAFLKGKK